VVTGLVANGVQLEPSALVDPEVPFR